MNFKVDSPSLRKGERKKTQKFFRLFSPKLFFSFLAILTLSAALGAFVYFADPQTKSATFGWIQEDWSGGSSENTADHETDQTGWTEFASKDDNIDVSSGNITLQNTSEILTDTTDADFGNAEQTGFFEITGGEAIFKKPHGAECSEDAECVSEICESNECYCEAGLAIKGGVVADCDFNGRTLIVQETDISGHAAWGCKGTELSGADSTTDGAQNTQDILDSCSESGIAARLCDESTEGGFDDWYLPATDELDVLYQNKDVVGGFSSAYSWSSSELSSDYARGQSFGDGNQSHDYKYSFYRVRCLRSL